MHKILLATGNQGKVDEMQTTIQAFGYDVVPQSDFKISEAVEDGLSFVENAIIKARYACKHTGLPAIADDSGLEVDALNGAPGIYSSRYAAELFSQYDNKDQANNAKLLEALNGVKNRAARFQCVIVMLEHELDPTPVICQGTWDGEIALQSKGDNGFGYDPLFYIPTLDCHSAELSSNRKKQFSHRAQALKSLAIRLQERHEFNT